MAAMENMALWHERDITHSSVERIIIPDSTILLHYMLDRLYNTLSNLKINTERMKKNIELTRGLVFSQRVLLALTEKMPSREEAYELVQSLAMKSWDKGASFRTLLKSSSGVRKYLNPKEIDTLFDISYYTRKAAKIINRATAK